MPFIVFGSQIILKLLDRFPIIILLGGGLLGWIAGGLILGDKILTGYAPQNETAIYIASAIGALFVVGAAKWLQRRRTVKAADA